MSASATKKSAPLSFRNPLETLQEEIKNTGADLVNAPKDVLQESSDQMWAAIYGTKPNETKTTITGSKEEDTKMGYTYLDVEKLKKAQASGDAEQVKRVNEQLQEESTERQENQGAHRSYMSEIERAIQELKQKEEERKKKIAEEEAQKHQQEEEAKAAQQQNSSDGAAKTKGRLGGARPKAQVETNFEASKGRTGK